MSILLKKIARANVIMAEKNNNLEVGNFLIKKNPNNMSPVSNVMYGSDPLRCGICSAYRVTENREVNRSKVLVFDWVTLNRSRRVIVDAKTKIESVSTVSPSVDCVVCHHALPTPMRIKKKGRSNFKMPFLVFNLWSARRVKIINAILVAKLIGSNEELMSCSQYLVGVSNMG